MTDQNDSVTMTGNVIPPDLVERLGELQELAGDDMPANVTDAIATLRAAAASSPTTGTSDVLAGDEPWRAISTERSEPTLATLWYADGGEQYTGWLYLDEGDVVRNAEGDSWVASVDAVGRVELLHTFEPSTHLTVPAEPTDAMVDALRARFGDGHSGAVLSQVLRDVLAIGAGQ